MINSHSQAENYSQEDTFTDGKSQELNLVKDALDVRFDLVNCMYTKCFDFSDGSGL